MPARLVLGLGMAWENLTAPATSFTLWSAGMFHSFLGRGSPADWM